MGPQTNCSFIQQDHSHQQHLNHLTTTHISITMATLHYLPPVKPSAIALGVVFNQVASVGVLAPLFGDTYQRAKAADSKEEFFKSKEAATAAASWGSSLVGSAIQTYGVAALINATGTLSYKGSAYLGSLIFMLPTLHLSSPPLSLRTDPSKSSLSVFCLVSQKPSVSACSSPTGALEPTHSTREFAA